MMARWSRMTEEELQAARADYEGSKIPVVEIAARLGIRRQYLHKMAGERGWSRHPIPHGGAKKPTDPRAEEWAKAYAAGSSLDTIAEASGVTKHIVSYTLRVKLGMKLRAKKTNIYDHKRIAGLAATMTVKQISDETGVPKGAVVQALKRSGVKAKAAERRGRWSGRVPGHDGVLKIYYENRDLDWWELGVKLGGISAKRAATVVGEALMNECRNQPDCPYKALLPETKDVKLPVE